MQIKKLLHLSAKQAKVLSWFSFVCQKCESCNDSLLGLDINSSAIRLVALSRLSESYQLTGYMNVDLVQPVADEEISNILRKAYEQINPNNKEVAVALPHSAVFFKEIELEKGLTNKKRDEFLQFNIKKYFGDSCDNINFDYHIHNLLTKGNNYITLQLIAARREMIERYIQWVQAAGLQLKIVDISSYALERIIRCQFKEIVGLVAIVNVDYSSILTIVIDNEKMIYAHEEMMAEKELRLDSQIIVQIELQLQRGCSKLQQPLTTIVLTGILVSADLIDVIKAKYNIPTMFFDPFLNMKIRADMAQEQIQKIASAMTISCGLALRMDK